MRIAFFTNTYCPHIGGVANSVSALAGRLRERGHRCMVFAPDYPGEARDETDVVRIPAIENFNGSGYSFRLPFPGRIHSRLEELRPELIHSHHPYLLGDAALRSAAFRKVPLVFTHHTLYEQYVHHLFEKADLLERVASELATEYANLCDRVIAPSESIRNLITGRGVVVPVSVIPTGIDLPRFARGSGSACRKLFGIPPEATVIGHVSRLEAEKNLLYLAEAVTLFLQAEKEAWFLVAGKGSLQERMANIFREGHVLPRVAFAGLLTREQLIDAYHGMNVFVFSSKSETQGMVLAEAMAAGIPVVALDASGVREVVKDGWNGRLLPVDADSKEFCTAIQEWLATASVDESWREAVNRTAALFSEDNCLLRMEALYRDLIQQHPVANPMTVWEKLAASFEAEWELAAEKARAASTALTRK